MEVRRSSCTMRTTSSNSAVPDGWGPISSHRRLSMPSAYCILLPGVSTARTSFQLPAREPGELRLRAVPRRADPRRSVSTGGEGACWKLDPAGAGRTSGTAPVTAVHEPVRGDGGEQRQGRRPDQPLRPGARVLHPDAAQPRPRRQGRAPRVDQQPPGARFPGGGDAASRGAHEEGEGLGPEGAGQVQGVDPGLLRAQTPDDPANGGLPDDGGHLSPAGCPRQLRPRQASRPGLQLRRQQDLRSRRQGLQAEAVPGLHEHGRRHRGGDHQGGSRPRR